MNRRRLIEITASLLLVFALIYAADLGKTFLTISQVDVSYYILAVGIFMTTYLSSGRRWQIIAGTTDHEISLRKAIKVVAVSYSFNKLLPWNFGDMVRSKISESYHEVESHGSILGGAGFERVLDAGTLSFIILFSALFTSTGQKVLSTVVPFGLIFLLGSILMYSKKADLIVKYAPDRAEEFVLETIRGFRAVSKRELVELLTLSQLKWWAEALTFYVLAVSITSSIGFWDAAIVTSIISVFAALPISPAGIGPGDAAATGLLVFAGMSYSGALSLVLLQRSIGVVIQGAVGAIIYGLDL